VLLIDEATGFAGLAEETVGAGLAAEGWDMTVANTPPDPLEVEETTWEADVKADDGDVEADVATGGEPEEAPGEPVAAVAVAHPVPVAGEGVAVAVPNKSSESPGSGNSRSVESWVVHPLPILATNILGRALYVAASRSMS